MEENNTLPAVLDELLKEAENNDNNNSIDTSIQPEKKKRGRPRKQKTDTPTEISSNDTPSVEMPPQSDTTKIDDVKILEEVKEKKPKTAPDTKHKDKLADILSSYKETPVNEINGDVPPQPVNLAAQDKLIINGYLLLVMCDAFFPLIIKIVIGIFYPALKKIPTHKIKLTKEQKESLEPIADRAAAHMFENANPISMFIFAMGSCYLSNAIENLPDETPKRK